MEIRELASSSSALHPPISPLIQINHYAFNIDIETFDTRIASTAIYSHAIALDLDLAGCLERQAALGLERQVTLMLTSCGSAYGDRKFSTRSVQQHFSATFVIY